jgi:hypothetical protein
MKWSGKIAVLGLGLCGLFALVSADQAHASFARTCEQIRLLGTQLVAVCEKVNGTFAQSTVELNDVVGNDNGRLVFGASGFARACDNIQLQGAVLQADCLSASGNRLRSRLNLDAHIANDDGQLIVQ